jgi:predicted anti-sigma-YlaC factor YlaD
MAACLHPSSHLDSRTSDWGHAMTCKTAVGTICNYLEGNLSAHGVMALRRHLEECKDCRMVLDAAERTLEIDFDRIGASATPHNATAA